MKTMEIKGTGNLNVKPDVCSLRYSFSAYNVDYEGVIKEGTRLAKQIVNSLVKLGFNKDEIKTISFDIERRTNYNEKTRVYEFSHYELKQVLRLNFDIDNKLLSKLLTLAQNYEAEANIDISYTYKDKEAAKDELLANCIKDAKRKANVLALASEVKLGDIVNIEYSTREYDFDVRPYSRNSDFLYMRSNSVDIDINPDDIKLTDTVRLVYEIL